MKSLIPLMLLSTALSASATPSIGNSDVTDVTLNGQVADGVTFSTANGQAGPNGNTSVFNTAFTGSWDLLTKVDSSGGVGSVASVLGAPLSVSFSLNSDKKSGTFSITSTQDLVLDLVLGIHGGGGTASFFFNDEQLHAGQTANGTFKIDWFNASGKNVPNYSNMTMFYKDASVVSSVPEPETYAMLLGGLGIVSLLALRNKKYQPSAAIAV